ncbi:MAG: PQQ-binding-like beta-propeller repeat protein [Chloroflexi bacterium]|nr:PQQ-binding-like beta-propeller repeat protein [Chloroflexota bacterium]
MSTKLRRLRLVAALMAVLLLASACVALPLEAGWTSLSLVGDPARIFLAYSDVIALINPSNGQAVQLLDANGNVRLDSEGNPRVWSVELQTAATFYSAPVFPDPDTMLMASYEQRVFQIGLSDARVLNGEGAELPGNVVSDPVLAGNRFIVGFNQNSVSALDAENLDTLWSFETERGVWTQPLLLDDTVLIPTMNHILHAVNVETGVERWSVDLGGAVASTPLHVGGDLFVGTLGRRLFRIDARNGDILAEYETQGWVWCTPALADGVLYLADLDGYVYALTIDSNGAFEELWRRQVASSRGIRATPIVTEDTIIVGARDRVVYWLDRSTGAPIADGQDGQRAVAGEILADMLLLEPSESLNIDEPVVLVSTNSREELLIAFTVDTGRREWTFRR